MKVISQKHGLLLQTMMLMCFFVGVTLFGASALSSSEEPIIEGPIIEGPIIEGPEVGPPDLGIHEDKKCERAVVCTGAAVVGQCQPQGLVCNAGISTCGQVQYDADGCNYKIEYDCVDEKDHKCQVISSPSNLMGFNCKGQCEWLFYNQCACSCSSVEGAESFSGPKDCRTIKPKKPKPVRPDVVYGR